MKKLDMKPHNAEGLLITFCGLDGCGKTSMINIVAEYLHSLGEDVVLTKQPTNTVRKSEIFRNFMDYENHEKFEYRALSLFAAADRIQHSNKIILPELKNKKVVISDRYFYSCLANLRARGYKSDRWIYEIVKDIPKPDLAFFLDVPVEVAVERVRQRPEEKNRYIDMDLQYKLREEYINICAENGGILIPSIDEPSVTFDRIWNCVYDRISEKNEK